MSLPMMAVGPLKVETKPILMVLCWADTGAVSVAMVPIAAAPTAMRSPRRHRNPVGLLIVPPLLRPLRPAPFVIANPAPARAKCELRQGLSYRPGAGKPPP